MITFRWTDQRRVSEPFRFSNRREFRENALDALLTARNATVKKYHDGKTRQDCRSYPELHLHVFLKGRWYNLGRIRETARGSPFFTPAALFAESFTVCNGLLLSPREQKDDKELISNLARQIWDYIEDTYGWASMLDQLAKDVAENN